MGKERGNLLALPTCCSYLLLSPQEFVWEASHYLVRQVFKSLQEMFSGTRAIQVRPCQPSPIWGAPPPHGSLTQPGVLSHPQHWLTESANLISHAGWPVEWVTPLGIPVIQPYHRESKVQVLGKCPSPLPSSLLPAQGWTHLSPNPALQVKGGIQSITVTSSVDDNQ